MYSNLPPGVTEHDIPGNTDQDVEFERALEHITCTLNEKNISESEIITIWNLGLLAYEDMGSVGMDLMPRSISSRIINRARRIYANTKRLRPTVKIHLI